MVDFSHISEQRKQVAQTEITIEGLSIRPVLTCLPATVDNPAYYNAVLKRQRPMLSRGGRNITAKMLKRFINDDRELMAQHCVIGWDESTVTDAKGKKVPFSKDACLDLFRSINDTIFDIFRNELADQETFMELDNPADVEAQAGNLPAA